LKLKKKKKLELTGNLIQSFIPEAHLLTNTVLGKTHGENVLLLLVAIQKWWQQVSMTKGKSKHRKQKIQTRG